MLFHPGPTCLDDYEPQVELINFLYSWVMCFIQCDHSSKLTVYFLAENSLAEATKEVAEALGGDVKQTESELLNKLLAPSQTVKQNENEAQKPSVSLR
jgi:hypothetical protein